MSPRLTLAAAMTLVACTAGGPKPDIQPLDCTEIGCSDGLDGMFSPAFTAQGAYVFTLEAEGFTSTCTGQLPLDEDFVCKGDLQVTRSGSALPDSEHSLPSFRIFSSGFAEFSLTVTLDGAEVASWNVSPQWDTIQPNGAGCDPICDVADVTLSWP
ncbi:MAG: hypothetical protein ACON5B_12795 [Myxococcota bacterium]